MTAVAVAMVVAGTGAAGQAREPDLFARAWRAAWVDRQEDPAGRMYREAREALTRARYREAAGQFERIRASYPASAYVADSFYWEAFALSRVGNATNLRNAANLLRVQAADHARAATRADADALLVRIEAQLAQGGDAAAAAVIAQQAAQPCGGNQEVRTAALSALMNMNPEQAVPILREVLASRDECSVELRRRAVFIIAQTDAEASVDILLDLAHRNPDPDPEVREQAVFWLHQVDAPEALDALEAIRAESNDPALQERAMFSIAQRSSGRAMAMLRGYAERADAPRELREQAIFWIGQSDSMGGAAYLMELYARLQDEELRERALFGIAQNGGPEARQWLFERASDTAEPVELRKNALFWAGQMGGLEVAELRRLYATLSDPEMKEQVIFVAAQDEGPGAVDFMMEVARTDADQDLRERAIFWLGQTSDPRVPEFLLSLIRN
jgi:HEAT repeat protein